MRCLHKIPLVAVTSVGKGREGREGGRGYLTVVAVDGCEKVE